jgi:hypothetical protein
LRSDRDGHYINLDKSFWLELCYHILMSPEILKAVVVVTLALGMLIFQKQINRFFNHFWREKKLKRFLLNPITATASSLYLIVFVFNTNVIWDFLLDSDVMFIFFLAIIAVPIYSFKDLYSRKTNREIKSSEHGLEGLAYRCKTNPSF